MRLSLQTRDSRHNGTAAQLAQALRLLLSRFDSGICGLSEFAFNTQCVAIFLRHYTELSH